MPARILRQLANKHWVIVLLAWVALAVSLRLVAPDWETVAHEGDLEHLPRTAASVAADELLREAFPEESSHSEVVLLFDRDGDPLTVADRQFALDVALLLEGEGGELPIVGVWHAKRPLVSRMLLAPGGAAEMVILRLSNPLMSVDNIRVLKSIEDQIGARMVNAPVGLRFSLTGSAAIGAETLAAARESLQATHQATLLLVLACLVLIYRAPLLVLVPLATIGLSVSVAMSLIVLLANVLGPGGALDVGLKVFTTTRVFVIVILFGAGTDYCLFLIARYREELGRGVTPHRAPGIALRNVSGALAGSALTTILGLGVMAFAEYGKFASSGPIIALCLAVALAACVSFAPSLLRALGPRVFWPGGAPTEDPVDDTWGVWATVADTVLARPAAVLFVCVAVMSPLVWFGWHAPTEHNLLASLPQQSRSLEGAKLVGRYFGDGWLAPMKLVVRLPGADLSVPDARYDVALLHNALYDLPGVQDVRSPYLPTGGDPKQQRRFSFAALYSSAAAGSPLSINSFVSSARGYSGEVLQMSLILAGDPFGQAGRDMVPAIRESLRQINNLPKLRGEPNPWRDAEFRLAGATPGLVDLERVAATDQRTIQLYSVLAVLAVLLVLTRRPLACLYLVATVLLSYWVTLGATDLFFGWLWGPTYHGLDWKAPIFLFVILVAVGQDYNIYLTTRVLEEQRRLGPREGLRRAIIQTGGIITSCGVIMAGTFVSMMAGSLRGMIELGFALSLGVVLDTFVVRTLLVPCYFSLVLSWQERGFRVKGKV
ncbi:putative membrane protein YdgH [Posidoniimonas polymericola]|uniref:Putative membrane protein YdgH n=1 Tax=Posidoniimonas polymericola TaxID=2528002 RepID=A0A5C5YIH4_9BACT|nr:MMPL family transporter [Posidoniimonas polymericola]TWT74667.1 putative membrane protein YdgH [Posidoniimonas polymericola]